MKSCKIVILLAWLLTSMLLLGCGKDEPTPTTSAGPGSKVEAAAVELSDAQIENIVRRLYQYVAMYNVNNKFALKQGGGTPVLPTPDSRTIRCGR